MGDVINAIYNLLFTRPESANKLHPAPADDGVQLQTFPKELELREMSNSARIPVKRHSKVDAAAEKDRATAGDNPHAGLQGGEAHASEDGRMAVTVLTGAADGWLMVGCVHSDGTPMCAEDCLADFCLKLLACTFPTEESLGAALLVEQSLSQLMTLCKDGVLPCKLLNAIIPGTIDERAINLPAATTPASTPDDNSSGLSAEAITENMRLLYTSAYSVGCSLEGVALAELLEGQASAMLRLVLHLITLGMLNHVGPAVLEALKGASDGLAPTGSLQQQEGEENPDQGLQGMPTQKLLMTWMQQRLRSIPVHPKFMWPERPSEEGSNPELSCAQGTPCNPTVAELVALLSNLLGHASQHVADPLQAAPVSDNPLISGRQQQGEESAAAAAIELCSMFHELETRIHGEQEAGGTSSSSFRLDPRHLQAGAPEVLLVCLAAAFRGSLALPMWVLASSGQHAQQLEDEDGVDVGASLEGRSSDGDMIDEQYPHQPQQQQQTTGSAMTDPCMSSHDAAAAEVEGTGLSMLSEDGTCGSAVDVVPSSTVAVPGFQVARRARKQQQPSKQGTARRADTRALEMFNGDADEVMVDTHEEKLLTMWLNSLDPRIKLTSLSDKSMQTGWPLLLAVDAIQPGSVQWDKVFNLPFRDKAQKIMGVCNCNQAVDICHRWALPLVNIGGIDIAEGRHMATLSLVWQMMRHHISIMLQNLVESSSSSAPGSSSSSSTTTTTTSMPTNAALAGVRNAPANSSNASPAGTQPQQHDSTPQKQSQQLQAQRQGSLRLPAAQQQQRQQVEVEVLRWANERLRSSGYGGNRRRIRSLGDLRLTDGQVLLQLLAAISPRSIDPVHVLPGTTNAERESNAKYVISVARKLGCTLFLGWQDLLVMKAKSSLILLASLMALDLHIKKSQESNQGSKEARAQHVPGSNQGS